MEWTHLRKYPRVPVDLPAVYTLNDCTRQARILSLGGGGLFLADPEPSTVGASLSVGFRPAKHFPQLHVKAEVRYVISGKGMGVEFIDLDCEYRQKLMAFILHRMGSARQFLRAPLAAQVECEKGSQIGFLKNISEGGMFIEAKEPVASGTHLKIRFNLDDGGPTIIVGGEVRYSVMKIGMGIRFGDLSTEDQKRIAVFLAKHGATHEHSPDASEESLHAETE
jgi:hypothetical protein